METLEEILEDISSLFEGPHCRESVAGIAKDAHAAGHRSGLLRAARRASAMAGKDSGCFNPDRHGWTKCVNCAMRRLAAKLREEVCG